MDKQLKSAAMKKVRAVEEALRAWDPIGVFCGEGSPKDEYDSYAPHIVSLVQSGTSVTQLTAHLSHLRKDTMGLPENPESDRRAAELIIEKTGEQV